MLFRRRGAVAALLALGALGSAAQAQDFPARAIKFVVPFGPGSGTDTSARYFASKLQELTGQSVLVENRPGANGFLAIRQVLAAPADGYTVLIGSNSTLAVNAALFRALPYDPVADFTPLSMLMRTPAMLAVPPEAPYASVQDFVAHARQRPGRLNYGAYSAGYRLMAELLNVSAGIEAVHVPFKSPGEATAAVASATVDYIFADTTSVAELAKGGRLKVLAITAGQRAATMAQVPTFAEAGLPEVEVYAWVGAVVSSKTPAQQAARLADLFVAIAQMPETRQFYARVGAEVMGGGAAQMRAFQQDEIALWQRIVAQAGVPLQ